MKNIRSVLMLAVSVSLMTLSAQAQTKGDYPQGPSKGQVQGRPGPNPYPPGTKGNPGGYNPGPRPGQGPVYHPPRPNYPQHPPVVVRPNPYPPQYPNYPQYPSYPRTYPNYPSASIAPCVLISNFDGYSTSYQVLNGYGSLVRSTYSYSEALSIADQQERIGACYGVIYQAQNNNYPNYPQSANYCQVMQGGNAYGQILYRVTDRAGRILVSTTDYQQAQYISQSDARCFQYN
jgi:hypothetical protein